jgi:argininosuccinate lyase
VDTLLLTLPALAGAAGTAAFRPERMRQVMDAQVLATDLADHLVRRGVPFRESHEVIGRLVRRSEEAGVSLSALEPAAFREEHPAFGDDVGALFDWTRSADSRDGEGGTSRRSVLSQIERARGSLAGAP